MTKIKNLQMLKELSADARVSIKSGFLGLTTTAVYNKTNSALKGYAPEYRMEEQKVAIALVNAASSELESAAKKLSQLKDVDFGQLKLEAVVSDDHQFAALQAFVTDGFKFHPATGLKIYEGADAEIIATLF